jgi:FkbM family methyltransferase
MNIELLLKKVYNKINFFSLNLAYYIIRYIIHIFDFFHSALFIPIKELPYTYRGPKLLAHIIEKSNPIIKATKDEVSIKLFCPGIMPIYRAKTFFEKEPETIDWINNFEKDSTFWDIGANIGVYSLFAALKNHTVYSFEPSAPNYYVLNKNIEINKLDNQIQAFNIALAFENEISHLRMGDTTLGGADNSFKEPIKESGEKFIVKFNQAIIGFTIDEFISRYRLSIPNYIKIDVDGNEMEIIKGMKKTFSDSNLHSLLVELSIDRPDYNDIIKIFELNGFVNYEVINQAFDEGYPIRNHIFSKL